LKTRLCLFFLLTIGSAMAQFSSAIQGTVADVSKGTIPDAKVTVRNQATGVVRETTTNAEGVYRVSSLWPFDYSVTLE